MKRCLTNLIYGEHKTQIAKPKSRMLRVLTYILARRSLRLVRQTAFDPEQRLDGRDWPARAHTMIGLKRLDNLQRCIEYVLANNVPGDLIETGVWRGGATIFMRACLAAHGVSDRVVWVADSFEGLPSPDPEKFPHDAGDKHSTYDYLRVSLDEVKSNFQRYGLLDGQVRFLKGWFRDTLPNAPVRSLAILRLDGDMYESTIEALDALYPRVSVGGYVIVDDYGAVRGCKQAIDDFRREHALQEPIQQIDWTGVYWQRTA